jgi:hypothetical protein
MFGSADEVTDWDCPKCGAVIPGPNNGDGLKKQVKRFMVPTLICKVKELSGAIEKAGCATA